MYIPLETMKYFLLEFERKFQGYSVEKKCTPNGLINVYLLNDSLVVLAELVGTQASLCYNAEEMYGDYRDNPYLGFPVDGRMYYTLRIEELTPNEIGFKYSNAKFVGEMEAITQIPFLSGAFSYSRFESYRSDYWYLKVPDYEPDANIKNCRTFPALQLQERCDAWIGKRYYFIVIEFEDVNGDIHRTCAYAMEKPHAVFLSILTIALAGSMLCSALGIGQTPPDYRFVYVGTRLPDDCVKALEEGLASLAEDCNGDGTVSVTVTQCVTAGNEDLENQMYGFGGEVALLADITEGERHLFLMEDPESFQLSYQILAHTDGSIPAEDDFAAMDKVFARADCPTLTALELGSYEDAYLDRLETGSCQDLLAGLYLGQRYYYDAAMEEYPEANERLWKLMTEGAAQ